MRSGRVWRRYWVRIRKGVLGRLFDLCPYPGESVRIAMVNFAIDAADNAVFVLSPSWAAPGASS